MKKGILFVLLLILLLISNPGYCAKEPIINIQIDGEYTEGNRLTKIVDELVSRNINATVYVSTMFVNDFRDVAKDVANLGFEIAIHGYKTGEILESLDQSEQERRIKSTYIALQGCLFCEKSPIMIRGFRPQYFSQNEITYGILDEMGILYDSGFIESMVYLPGFKDYSQPYKVKGHKFYAVPISSYYYEPLKDMVYLCDMSIKNKYKLTANQWLEILEKRLEISIETGKPMVIIIHDLITGLDEGYFNVFVRFLDEIKEKGIKTVSTTELVNIYK
ncbi:MAG: polysaccharide deacetylase family protein [bacterium]